MKKLTLISLIFIFAAILAACSITTSADAPPEAQPAADEDPNAVVTQAVMTVYAQLTQTAEAAALTATAAYTPPPTEAPTEIPPTEIPTEAFTPTPEIPPTQAPTATATSNMPCNRANLETKTVQDNDVVFVGRTFTQTFRIKNTGSCTWNQNYELRFAQGDLMGAGASIPMGITSLPTWSYVHVDILMKAPDVPGTYTNYWMIKSDKGEIFGVGTAANGWFWTTIKVINPDA
ncbi:MAG: hypothetical protein HN413_06180 [Chloroflexi bacterium]|jgi:hypothetical protein|nr:hypothetical protein [Chloroflexota bacterium]